MLFISCENLASSSLILFLEKIDLHSLSIQGKTKNFLASNFLTFVSNRFSMLHIIFYKQLRSGDNVLKIAYDFQ